jgi:hypothetical protein
MFPTLDDLHQSESDPECYPFDDGIRWKAWFGMRLPWWCAGVSA